MNERSTIAAINSAHPIQEGSKPHQITAAQQRACVIVGKLLLHAHKRKKRRAGRWV
jgi:hypothetical protein